jgi:tRNA pseudouridine38-40 synthase
VQDEVEKSLRRLYWQGRRILAAGRTDAGVHALGQVIAFDLDWKHSPDELRQALNATLPVDIVAREVRAVSARFDPRRQAVSRCYQYRLFCQEVRDPLRERYAWRIWPPAEASLLEQAAARMVGRLDFRAFGTPPQAGGSTLRTVWRSAWNSQEAGWVYEVEADAFLYHMVRRMVAIQVAVGQGKASLADLARRLDPGPEDYVQGLAPPQGLFLVSVAYPPE